MPKSKINVTSNKLDQAPKTRAAGYGKVVDSMRDEMTEALNGVNVPKILSNKSDQAPKTRAAGYEKNVLEPLQNEINKRMDMLFLNWAKFEVDWNKSIRDYLQKFLNDKGNEFIWNCILKTQPWDSFTFEIKREKIKPTGWFSTAVWHPAFLWDSSNSLGNYIHNFYWRAGDWYIKPWEMSTAIVVKKDAENPDLLHIHAEQLEYPAEWSLLMDWLFFHNPNVKDKEFEKIAKTLEDESKEETKELLKENIKEEIEIEEKESKREKTEDKGEKSEEKSEKPIDKKPEDTGKNKKKSLKDTFKWWFK